MHVTRRDFLRSMMVAAGAAMLPGTLRAAAAGAPAARKPNFLLIVMDDMGYSDPGCYGGDIATPNVDRLAAGGIRFTQCYSTARCWPSRACLLTGYYAQQVRRDALPGLGGGTSGKRPAWARLVPEMLRPLGYRSYHSGKWHVDGLPTENGFDRSFDNTDGNHHFLTAKKMAESVPPLEPPGPEGYYAATAAADNAICFLRDHAANYAGQPFFQYLAFIEPHFPIQAMQADIDRYRDRYLGGWDALRQERWKRMTEMGLVNCKLSKPDPDIVPGWNMKPDQLKAQIGPGEEARAVPWATLTDEQKRLQATKMAIHAAMVDRVDREIGRVLDQIKAMGALENTVVFFVSDNGASAEQMIRGDGHDPAAPLGSAKSFLCLGPGWSTASNTPFRLHKSWVHEGGISSPLVVHWPAGIKARGELRHDVCHFVDIPRTLVDLAGGQWPEKWGDTPVPPPPALSLVPAFAGDGGVKHEFLWWLHQGNRAIRVGDLKLVSVGAEPWELYDLSTDRSESNNLAAKQPEKVKELSDRWTSFMEDCKRLATGDGQAAAPAGQAKKKGKKE